MTYGIPCPPTPQPADVFTGIQQTTDILTGLVTAIEGDIQNAYQTALGYTSYAIGLLQKSIQSYINQTNNILSSVVNLLQSSYQSSVVSSNVQFSSTLQEISDVLQQPTDFVLYGPPVVPGAAPPYPYPGTPGQPYPPGYPPPPFGAAPGPGQFQPSPAPNLPAPQPVTVYVDGAPLTVNPVCQQQQIGGAVTVGGQQYAPTVTVYSSGAGIPTNPDGTPRIPVGYDSQPDGSIVVYVGPVHIRIALPPADPHSSAPACQLVAR